MKKSSIWYLATVGLAVIVLALFRQAGADDPAPKEKPLPTELAKQLVGTWVLDGAPPANGHQLKFLTGRHWVITEADPKTGKVVWHHGGSYTLNGDTYTETVEYANESTAELIGKTFKFQAKVNGDVFQQSAIGEENPFTQKWKRAK